MKACRQDAGVGRVAGRALIARHGFLPAVVLALVVLGALLSGELVKQHDNIWGDSEAKHGWWAGLCEAAAPLGLSCTQASKGRWSEIRLPMPVLARGYRPGLGMTRVPVAFLGLAYFVCLATWFLMVGAGLPPGGIWHRVPLALTAMGAAVSCFFLVLMAAGFAPRCLLCVLVHGVNLQLTAVVWGWRWGKRDTAEAGDCVRWSSDRSGVADAGRHGGRPLRIGWDGGSRVERADGLRLERGHWLQAIRAMVVALVLVGGLWVYRGEHLAFKEHRAKLMLYKTLVTALRNDKAFLLREHLAEPVQWAQAAVALPVSDNPQLVIFSDYDCPNCACGANRIVDNARQAFGERLEVVVRHYPLCGTCNPHVQSTARVGACQAALAAEAARLQGGEEAFRLMHERLFMRRQGRDRESLARLAEELGLDRERFLADLEGDAVRRTVAQHVALAHAWGVRGTPALFFEGRRVNRQFEGPAYWEALAENWRRDDGTATALTQRGLTPRARNGGDADGRR